MVEMAVHLFARFSVTCQTRVVPGFDSGKVQELFSYLLLFHDRPHTRDHLAEVLWGNCAETSKAKKYLRQTLWQLQSALALSLNEPHDHWLLVDAEWVRLELREFLCLDVALFERACTELRGIFGKDLTAAQAQLLANALHLYAGELLQGWTQDWCLCERERLQNLYLGALDKLGGYCEAQKQYEAGIEYSTRILQFEPAHERAHRRLMRLQYLAGNRTAALRQYDRCTEVLAAELNVRPDRHTQQLYEKIRLDQTLSTPAAPATEPRPTDPLARLTQMMQSLTVLQHQIQEDIQLIKDSLLGRH